VGKTGIAVHLAERLNGEIISADSRLFYRGMDIGTAKPSFEERQRVPHHLVDVADPDEVWSLSLFQKCACQAISDIYARGKLPFLVGGTGQYIRAVVHGGRCQKSHRIPKCEQRWSLGHKLSEVLDCTSVYPCLTQLPQVQSILATCGAQFAPWR